MDLRQNILIHLVKTRVLWFAPVVIKAIELQESELVLSSIFGKATLLNVLRWENQYISVGCTHRIT